MNRGLLIGGGLLLGGGALYLATRERGVLEGVVEAVYDTAGKMMTTPPPTVVQLVRRGATMVSGIAQAVLDNFKRWNIAALIDKYRDGFPWGAAAGIIYVESKGDAEVVNKKSGATGLVQIMPAYPRGLTEAQRKNPDDSLRVIMPEWRSFLKRAKDAGVTNERDQWSYVYYGHNQGAGALAVVLKYANEGFEQSLQHYLNFPWLMPRSYKDAKAAAKKAGTKVRDMTADELAVYAKAVAAHVAAATQVARLAADKGAEFAAAESSIKGVLA